MHAYVNVNANANANVKVGRGAMRKAVHTPSISGHM